MTAAENTKKFIAEWELYCALRGKASDPDPIADSRIGDVKPVSPAPFDPEIKGGQIRLLSQPDDFCHVLILRHFMADDNWLIVPFSPFPYPATDEEFYLGGKRTEYLDVLQFWNARSYHDETLRESWIVDTLNPQELDMAGKIWDASITGDALPEEMLSRMGLPITDGDDPRVGYKRENLEKFRDLDMVDFETLKGV